MYTEKKQSSSWKLKETIAMSPTIVHQGASFLYQFTSFDPVEPNPAKFEVPAVCKENPLPFK